MVYGKFIISFTMDTESGKTANEYFYDDGVKLVNIYAECQFLLYTVLLTIYFGILWLPNTFS